MTVRPLIGACVLLLMISAPGLAQTPAGSFEQLIAEGAIQPQQTVYVTDAGDSVSRAGSASSVPAAWC